MRIEALDPVGVVVHDVRLDRPDSVDVDEFVGLLADHGVIVVPGQRSLDDDGFVAFLARFGDLTFTTGETPVPGHPDLNVVTNVGRTTTPRSTFHTDTSYVSVPPAYTALRAVEVPERGGETLFSDQCAALDSLPDGLRRRVDGRTITHVVTGLDLDDDAETEAEHPIVRPHPVTGRPSLFLTAVSRCRSVSGLDDDEGRRLVQELFDHSTADHNVMDHSWRPGDVVMWDNARVLHRADHSDVVGDRTMHRGMVAGSASSPRTDG